MIPVVSPPRPALAAPVAIAGLVVAGLLVLSPAYGFHRDELYFIVAGRHPAFGYVDQPPLTPLLSAGAVALLGLSPTAIRILPALAVGVIVILAALVARDLGGGRRAQLVAALATALSGLLAAGHLASTTTYDLLAWAVVLWLVVRLLAGADPRLWLAVGAVAGLALENKHIVLFLGAGLVGGLVAARRWDVVRSPWSWGAMAIAAALWAPNLAWQAANGFPQLEMAAAIAAGSGDDRPKLALELLLLAGPFLFPVVIAGAWWLLRSRAAGPWRALGWATLIVLALVLVSGGKSYYAVGLYPLLFGAGAIAVDGWLAGRPARLRAGSFAVAAAASGALVAVLVLPIVPAASLGTTPIPGIYKESAEQVGWPELVAFVEGTAAALPQEDRARAVILTSNYGEAAALELLGHDLPPVHAGHNAYWDWGPPAADRAVVILVGGWNRGGWSRFFADCGGPGTFDNRLDLENEEQGIPLEVCRDPRQPWKEIWPALRHLG